MKNLIILLLLMFAFSCATKSFIPFNRTGAVECVAKDRSTITVQSLSIGHTSEVSKEYAVRNAFENLLFKGISNSNQERPMVSSQQDFLENSNNVNEALLINKEYQLFIISSDVLESTKVKEGYQTKVTLKIDLNGLRSYLEKKGAIRKFGI